MKRAKDKSLCPINYALESFGDTWSLLIVRDMVFAGKQTFREFLASEEGIATNILKARLDELVAGGIITKSPHPSDKRKEIYSLTEKGLALIPVLVELAEWSAQFNPRVVPPQELASLKLSKEEAIRHIREAVQGR